MQGSGLESEESLGSVVRRPAVEEVETPIARSPDTFAVARNRSNVSSSPSLRTLDSDAGSVLHHRMSNG
jgi:hypothetical protein